MYLMRVDARGALLRIECTGELTTAEAVRAVSQASALAEAGNIWAIVVDVTHVERGPAGSTVVAAAMTATHREGVRVAWITGAEGRASIDRLVRRSGLQDACRSFATEDEATGWLGVARAHVAAPAAPRASAGVERRPALTAGGPNAA